MPLFSTIRGQTHQDPTPVEDSVPGAEYVPIALCAHRQNGKDGTWTDANCPEKPQIALPGEAKMPISKASRQSRPLEIKAYISRGPWQRSTYSKFGALRSADFEGRFLDDPSTLLAVCRVRLELVHPITNQLSSGDRASNTIMRKATAYLAVVKTDFEK